LHGNHILSFVLDTLVHIHVGHLTCSVYLVISYSCFILSWHNLLLNSASQQEQCCPWISRRLMKMQFFAYNLTTWVTITVYPCKNIWTTTWDTLRPLALAFRSVGKVGYVPVLDKNVMSNWKIIRKDVIGILISSVRALF